MKSRRNKTKKLVAQKGTFLKPLLKTIQHLI